MLYTGGNLSRASLGIHEIEGGPGQDCPLYGGYICLKLQSGDPAFLSTPTRGGQARQGRRRCLHAKTTHHPECYATKRRALEPATGS